MEDVVAFPAQQSHRFNIAGNNDRLGGARAARDLLGRRGCRRIGRRQEQLFGVISTVNHHVVRTAGVGNGDCSRIRSEVHSRICVRVEEVVIVIGRAAIDCRSGRIQLRGDM